VIALSSGEAEYYGLVKGGSVGIGIQSMLLDMGVETEAVVLNTDATAAKGIASRRGLGKVRHLAVSQLWLQGKVASGLMRIEKVKGTENVADALTKHVERDKLQKHIESMNMEVRQGRHGLMPEVTKDICIIGSLQLPFSSPDPNNARSRTMAASAAATSEEEENNMETINRLKDESAQVRETNNRKQEEFKNADADDREARAEADKAEEDKERFWSRALEHASKAEEHARKSREAMMRVKEITDNMEDVGRIADKFREIRLTTQKEEEGTQAEMADKEETSKTRRMSWTNSNHPRPMLDKWRRRARCKLRKEENTEHRAGRRADARGHWEESTA